MMRMLGFSDDNAIVAEVPQGDIAGIAQHLDLLMLNWSTLFSRRYVLSFMNKHVATYAGW